MKPTDFPIHQLAELESNLTAQAFDQLGKAREALSGASGDLATACYESSLAYLEASRQASRRRDNVIAELDRAAAREAADAGSEPAHPWPIDGLQGNIGTELHPRWAVEAYTGSPETVGQVSLEPATTGDGDMILRIAVLPDWESENGAVLSVRIDRRDWRALAALAARIDAGQPIPHNEDGETVVKIQPTKVTS